MTDGEVQHERRGGRRQRILRKALIAFRDGNCTIGCQILDVSETGAKLMPADILLVPREFVLKPQDGEPRHCTVSWRRGSYIGVRYTELERQSGTQDDRRKRRRSRALQKGLIVFNNGLSRITCQVENLSDTGAKLLTVDPSLCPREFILQRQNSHRQCTVVWRNGSAIGVHFL